MPKTNNNVNNQPDNDDESKNNRNDILGEYDL